MDSYKIYEDISSRSNGDIYLGVVGPVRTGKSTFITQFLNKLVLPNILDETDKKRTIDEMPQSADGKLVMTTQPHFIPKEAVKIQLCDNVSLKVKLVDCVGFLVSGAEGVEDNNKKPRLVKTPWSETPVTFESAAEIGTKKVISEHSTVGIVVTTDGSFGDIKRENFLEAERKTVEELKKAQKPFVIVLNTSIPESEETLNLCDALQKKYEVPVVGCDIKNLSSQKIDEIFSKILQEFPLTSLKVKMPDWLRALPFKDEIISEIVSEAKEAIDGVNKVGDVNKNKTIFDNSENFEKTSLSEIDMGNGTAFLEVKPKQDLFYKVLSKQCGQNLNNDLELVSYIKKLAYAKLEYDKMKEALKQVEETGYGVVSPKMDEMRLEEPELVKQGSKFGVRLKASAPSLHLMRVDVETEISPIVGSEAQGEDLVKSLLKEYEDNPNGLWETNMFGRSLHSLVSDGLNKKIIQMPVEAQKKMRKTLSRIVNEGKGGIICILL